MAIRDVVTAGFGNGTFTSTIKFTVTRGYTSAPPPEFNENLIRTITRDLVRTLPYAPTTNVLTQ